MTRVLPVFLPGLVGAALVTAGGAPAALLPSLAEGPPAGHTGAFGQPSCVSCHFGAEVNAPGGRVVVEGLPTAYAPGARYTLTVVLESELMGAAGFQLGARRADGTQGGGFESVSERVAVRDSAGYAYAQHTRAGSVADDPDLARWNVVWVAPHGEDTVTLGVAANSGNGDDSPFSDLVYTTTVEVPGGASSAPARR